jgi:asparagine synthase (glutamine-hydrolysing)
LAIQDLSAAGHQPMSSSDGRYTIVFNGEIYNFLDLREELERNGEQFTSRTDTEVILRCYALEGESCLERFEGMFALAIWDAAERSCFLARDPLGIKPLYLWRHRDSLAFASEVRALAAADLAPTSLSNMALYEYFLYGSVQEPRTLIDQFEVLPAGHRMLWREGGGRRQRYWKLEFGTTELSRQEAIGTTRAALDDSIRRHLVSDVPVGVFLSGGIEPTITTCG